MWLDDANQTVGPDKVVDGHGPVPVRLALRAASPLFQLDVALSDAGDDAQLTVVPPVMRFPQFPDHGKTCACVNPFRPDNRKACEFSLKACRALLKRGCKANLLSLELQCFPLLGSG